MATIVDEIGAELSLESGGFAAQLRAEVQQALAAATAGAGENVAVRVETELVNDEQVRRRLRSLEQFVNQFRNRQRELDRRYFLLLTQRINTVFNRLRLRITQLKMQLATVKAPTLDFDADIDLDDVRRKVEAFRRQQEARPIRLRVDVDERGTARRGDGLDATLTRLTDTVEKLGDQLRVTTGRTRAYSAATDRATTSTRRAADLTEVLTDARAKADAAASALAAATERLSVAEQRHEQTGSALEAAEQRLARVRSRALPDSIGLERAEAALEAARAKHADTTARYFAEEGRLTTARRASENATRGVTGAVDDLARSLAGLVPLERDLARAREDTETTAGRVQGVEESLRARREEAGTAATALTAAERQLARARRDGGQSSSRIADLERVAESARDTAAATAERATGAEQQLTAARRDHETALGRLNRTQEASGRSGTRLGRAFGGLRGSLSAVGDVARGMFTVFSSGNSTFSKLAGLASKAVGSLTDVAGSASGAGNSLSAFGALAGGAGGTLAKLILLMGKFGGAASLLMAAAGAVTFVVGALGAALLGLPAALTGVGAAVGVAAIAFSGFGDAIAEANTPEELQKQQEALDKLTPAARAAAEAFNSDLRPAFDGIKEAVQEQFFQGMDQVVRDLSVTVRQALAPGLVDVAGSMNRFVTELAGVVTGEEGVNRVRDALSGAQGFIDNMTPGVRDLVQAFLDLAGVESIAQNLGGIIGDLSGKVANFFDEMRQTGAADAAVAALRGTVSNLADEFFDVLQSATNFFTETSPGFNNLVDSASNLAQSLIDDLGGAFNTALEAASDFIDNIPEQELDRFKDAIQGVADRFLDFANSPAPGQIVNVITNLVEVFDSLIGAFDKVMEIEQSLDNFWGGLGEMIGLGSSQASQFATDYERDIGQRAPQATEDFSNRSTTALEQLAQQGPAATGTLVTGIDQQISTLPGLTQQTFDQLPPIVQEQLAAASQAGITGAGQLHSGINEPMSEIPGITKAAFDQIDPIVQDALRAAAQSAQTGAAAVPPNIRDPLAQVPEDARAALDPTAPAVEGSMGEAADAAEAGSTAVVGNVDFGPILDKARELFGQVPGAVREGIDAAAGAVNEAGPRLVDAVRDQFTRAVQAGRDALGTGLQDAVREATGQAAEAMRQGVVDIVQMADFGAVATSAETEMVRVPTAVQTNLQTAQQHATAAGQGMTTSWQQTMQQIVQVTTQGWQRKTQVHQQGGQQALQVNQRTAQAIQQLWAQMAQIMYQAGLIMMQRLAQGIQQGGQQAIQAAQQVAQAIQGLFPMSPPKWGPLSGRGDPLRSGERIASRVATGIERRRGDITDALAPALAGIAGSLDGATPGQRASAVASSSGGGVRYGNHTYRDRAHPEKPRNPFDGLDFEDLFRLLAGAVREGMGEVEMRIRDDGRDGIARVSNRQNRGRARRDGARR